MDIFASILMKLTMIRRVFLDVLCTELYRNRKNNLENSSHYTDASKKEMTLTAANLKFSYTATFYT